MSATFVQVARALWVARAGAEDRAQREALTRAVLAERDAWCNDDDTFPDPADPRCGRLLVCFFGPGPDPSVLLVHTAPRTLRWLEGDHGAVGARIVAGLARLAKRYAGPAGEGIPVPVRSAWAVRRLPGGALVAGCCAPLRSLSEDPHPFADPERTVPLPSLGPTPAVMATHDAAAGCGPRARWCGLCEGGTCNAGAPPAVVPL